MEKKRVHEDMKKAMKMAKRLWRENSKQASKDYCRRMDAIICGVSLNDKPNIDGEGTDS